MNPLIDHKYDRKCPDCGKIVDGRDMRECPKCEIAVCAGCQENDHDCKSHCGSTGKFIRHYRKKAGFTHAELAKRLNYSRTAIVKWEGGKMPFVKLEPFIGLARAFKIKPGRFLDLYEKWEQENIHKPAN